MDDEDYTLTICDRCSEEIPQSEAHDGPADSEYEGTTLCPFCLAAVES